jgi:hypothetical protein
MIINLSAEIDLKKLEFNLTLDRSNSLAVLKRPKWASLCSEILCSFSGVISLSVIETASIAFYLSVNFYPGLITPYAPRSINLSSIAVDLIT